MSDLPRFRPRLRAACWVGALAFGAVLGAALAPLEAQEQLVMKVASLEVEDSPMGQQLAAYARWVHERTLGVVRVELLLGGRAGSAQELVRRTAEGSLQGFAGTAAEVARVAPALAVLQAPGALTERANIDAKLDGPVRARAAAALEARGLLFASWGPGAFRAWLTRKAPATSPAALADNGTDAVDAEPLQALASESHRSAKHLALCEHAYVPRLIVLSKRWHDGLPDHLKQAFINPPPTLVQDARSAAKAANDEAVRLLNASGVETHTCSAAEHRSFVEQARPSADALARTIGGEAAALLAAARD